MAEGGSYLGKWRRRGCLCMPSVVVTPFHTSRTVSYQYLTQRFPFLAAMNPLYMNPISGVNVTLNPAISNGVAGSDSSFQQRSSRFWKSRVPTSSQTPPYRYRSGRRTRSAICCPRWSPPIFLLMKASGKKEGSMYFETWTGEPSTGSSTRTVHEGPRRRTQLMTLRWFHGGLLDRPLCQKAHTFLSELVTGWKAFNLVRISSSAWRVRDMSGGSCE